MTKDKNSYTENSIITETPSFEVYGCGYAVYKRNS